VLVDESVWVAVRMGVKEEVGRGVVGVGGDRGDNDRSSLPRAPLPLPLKTEKHNNFFFNKDKTHQR
jgi:hypothetical protein